MRKRDTAGGDRYGISLHCSIPDDGFLLLDLALGKIDVPSRQIGLTGPKPVAHPRSKVWCLPYKPSFSLLIGSRRSAPARAAKCHWTPRGQDETLRSHLDCG
jgi:hypothetical protein